MTLKQIYKKYPTQESCIKLLESILWSGKPICPYCESNRSTAIPKEKRYRCNSCNTSYSVTAKTVFHKTRCDLQKWFFAIPSTLDASCQLSARELATILGVTKDTAWYMTERIKDDRKNLEIISTKLMSIL